MTTIRKRCIGSVHKSFVENRASEALQRLKGYRAPKFLCGWEGHLRRIDKAAKVRKAIRTLSDALWDVIESGAGSAQVAAYLIDVGHWPHELRAVLPSDEQLGDEAYRASERAYERSIGA